VSFTLALTSVLLFFIHSLCSWLLLSYTELNIFQRSAWLHSSSSALFCLQSQHRYSVILSISSELHPFAFSSSDIQYKYSLSCFEMFLHSIPDLYSSRGSIYLSLKTVCVNLAFAFSIGKLDRSHTRSKSTNHPVASSKCYNNGFIKMVQQWVQCCKGNQWNRNNTSPDHPENVFNKWIYETVLDLCSSIWLVQPLDVYQNTLYSSLTARAFCICSTSPPAFLNNLHELFTDAPIDHTRSPRSLLCVFNSFVPERSPKLVFTVVSLETHHSTRVFACIRLFLLHFVIAIRAFYSSQTNHTHSLLKLINL